MEAFCGLRAGPDGRRPRRPSTGCSPPARAPCAATPAGLLVGHDAISAFRGGRGGAPPRRIVRDPRAGVDDDHALVVAVTELERGRPRPADPALGAARPAGLGGHRRPRLGPRPRPGHPDLARWSATRWSPGRRAGRWRASASRSRTCTPSPGTGSAPATRPGWPRPTSRPSTPPRSRRLLDAGADVRRHRPHRRVRLLPRRHQRPLRHPAQPAGAAPDPRRLLLRLGHRGLAGPGHHRARHRHRRLDPGAGGLPGPLRASAPATARCPRDGLLPLAPSFDTVGWLTRDAALLAPGRRGAAAAAAVAGRRPTWSSSRRLLDLAEPDVADGGRGAGPRTAGATSETGTCDDLPAWLAAFQRLPGVGGLAEPRRLAADAARRASAPTSAAASRRPRGSTAQEAERARAARARAAGTRSATSSATGCWCCPRPPRSPRRRPGLATGCSASATPRMRLTCLAGIGGLPARQRAA